MAVVADPRVLRTLPERDFRGGLAEAVKHGLIADRAYFDWLEGESEAILRRDEAILTHLVRRSVEIKAEVVAADERETGRRATLNAGHTVAHALELASDYALSHGEAVALGLVAESTLAERLSVAESGSAARLVSLLVRLGLPVRLTDVVPAGRILEAMSRDKKNRMARIHFALPSAIGCMSTSGGWTRSVDEPEIENALRSIM
jgi:3-dehydroquinate synthetase